MPKLTVKLYAALKDSAGTGRMEVEGASIPEVLHRLGEMNSETFRSVLFDAGGKVKGGYQLLLGTAYLDPRKLDSVAIKDGDTLHVMPPIAGG